MNIFFFSPPEMHQSQFKSVRHSQHNGLRTSAIRNAKVSIAADPAGMPGFDLYDESLRHRAESAARVSVSSSTEIGELSVRVLFSSTPAFGHLLPLLPLARAAAAAGDEVAVVTSQTFSDIVSPLHLLPAGPEFSELAAEYYRRAGPTQVRELDAAAFGELFAAVRIDLSADEALDAAHSFGPDLLVCEREDTVGPLTAASLGRPWVRVLLGANLPRAVSRAVADRAAGRASDRGIRLSGPSCVVDPWPDALQPDGWRPSPDRIVMRPEAYRAAGRIMTTEPAIDDRPHVLLTPGTIAEDVAPIEQMLRSLKSIDVRVTLTGLHGAPWPIDVETKQVRQVPFAPLAELLEGVDLVILAGGSGTTTAVLSRGLPMVMAPLVFDQRGNAELAARTGAAIIAERPVDVGSATRTALEDPSYSRAAHAVAAQIAAMPSPADAWRNILERLVELGHLS